jgi:hypothetical protein
VNLRDLARFVYYTLIGGAIGALCYLSLVPTRALLALMVRP